MERDEAAARRVQPPETDEMTGTPEGWHKATQQIEITHYTTPFTRGSDNFRGLPGVPLLTQLHRPATLYRLALRRGSEREILPVGQSEIRLPPGEIDSASR